MHTLDVIFYTINYCTTQWLRNWWKIKILKICAVDAGNEKTPDFLGNENLPDFLEREGIRMHVTHFDNLGGGGVSVFNSLDFMDVEIARVAHIWLSIRLAASSMAEIFPLMWRFPSRLFFSSSTSNWVYNLWNSSWNSQFFLYITADSAKSNAKGITLELADLQQFNLKPFFAVNNLREFIICAQVE